MSSQAIGLADAMGLTSIHKVVGVKRPWRWMRGGGSPGLLKGLTPASASLEPPWPRLLISCGRRGAMVSTALKRASGGQITTVHIQDPQINPKHFDWVIAPQHDRLHGDNVITTRGMLHRITPERLADAKAAVSNAWAVYPRPWIGVLIGGATKKGQLERRKLDWLIANLRDAAAASGGSVLATPSRRTGEANIWHLAEGLADVPGFVWNGLNSNPFMGILGSVDHLVVSADSASMVSEAAATGVPVYTATLSRLGRRLRDFHDELIAEGITRPFKGQLENWRYEPVNDTQDVARYLYAKLKELGVTHG